ncbi:MAG: MBOAT family O-acyltransferase [Verrucomicrobiota bacterium]
MLFNSGTFLQFFAAFLLLYYCVRNHLRARNVLILAASYLFYGWWDYRFLVLLLFSSLLDYAVGLGLGLSREDRARKSLLIASIAVNLTILGFFKYYDFFLESAVAVLARLDIPAHLPTLRIVLPVGISFYTFQSMSYAIDVYRRQIEPTPDLVDFLAFVSFFPQLVAGPIERAQHLLPQFKVSRRITRGMLEEGVWLCLWGLFKKVALADNLAPLVEMVYDHPRPGVAMTIAGTVAFGFQIYGDFSGYSDIARGTAQILGFDIMVNFNLPYGATNLREFWSRWHISLSTWLRDYLYIGLGGNRHGRGRMYRNLVITMVLGGLWHGAAWNFVLWGLWHGIGLAVHRWWTHLPFRSGAGVAAPQAAWRRGLAWLATMTFVFYGWLLFRAHSWDQIVALTGFLGDFILPPWAGSYLINLALFTLPLVAMQWWQFRRCDLLVALRLPPMPRAALTGSCLIAVCLFWEKAKVPFIYFQF